MNTSFSERQESFLLLSFVHKIETLRRLLDGSVKSSQTTGDVCFAAPAKTLKDKGFRSRPKHFSPSWRIER
jgi:hypothetical protein